MNVTSQTYTQLKTGQAKQLEAPNPRIYAVRINPPNTGDVPVTNERFVRSILELQTGLLGIQNKSPIISYEVIRSRNNRLRLQFCVPSRRLERKIRTHLSTSVPGISFETGTTGLPLLPDDSIGGALLTTGREDRYPLQTEFDSPPINGLVAALHRHAMRDTRFVIQILFQPVVGKSVNEWWRRKQSLQSADYLRKEKQQVWGERKPTPRERRKADAVEWKSSQLRFWVSIRFAVIGAGEYTGSRVKELAGAFNIFENPDTGQYLNIHTIEGRRQKPFLGLYHAVRNRRFDGYSLKFQATTRELAGLLTVPDVSQPNLQTGQP